MLKHNQEAFMKSFGFCYILNKLKTYQVLQVKRLLNVCIWRLVTITCQWCVQTLEVCHTCSRTRARELHLGPHLMLVSP